MNPRAYTAHAGRQNQNIDFEKYTVEWIFVKWHAENVVSTRLVIVMALSVYPNFKDNDQENVYIPGASRSNEMEP